MFWCDWVAKMVCFVSAVFVRWVCSVLCCTYLMEAFSSQKWALGITVWSIFHQISVEMHVFGPMSSSLAHRSNFEAKKLGHVNAKLGHVNAKLGHVTAKVRSRKRIMPSQRDVLGVLFSSCCCLGRFCGLCENGVFTSCFWCFLMARPPIGVLICNFSALCIGCRLLIQCFEGYVT